MPSIYSGRGALAAFYVSILLAAAWLLWGAYDGYQAQRQFQRDLAAHSVRDAAVEIGDYIERRRADMARLAEGRGEILARLAADPADRKLQALLDRLLKERYHEYYAFSLATPTGELLTDLGEDISEYCREDLRRFAAGDKPYLPSIHPTPDHYHYDIMTRWAEGNARGIIFTSFTPASLARQLSGNQIPGHRLLLVKADSPSLIEVTVQGGRQVLGDNVHLSGDDQVRLAELGASMAVRGTKWRVLDVPGADVLAVARERMLWQMAGVVFIFVALGGVLAWFARSDARRRAEHTLRQAQAQQDLELRVEERTRDLHEKQAELERAQAISRIGSWKITYPGEHILASAEALRLYGLEPGARFTRERVLQQVHPEDRERLDQAWRIALEGTPMGLEFRVVVDGEERILHSLSLGARQTEDGSTVLEGTTQDITAQKQAEFELRRIAQIVETSGDLLAYVDRELRYQVANPAYAALFDRDAETLRGRTVREVLGEEMFQMASPYLDGALAGKHQCFITERAFPDGRHHVLDVEYRPFRSGEEVPGVVISIRDISKRVAAERALRDSELKLRAMLNTPFIFIGLLDTDGRLLQINSTALRMAGKDELQVLGLPFWETPWFSQDPEERERLRDAVVRGAQGQPSRFELAVSGVEGNIRHVDFAMQPLRNAEGRVVWLVPQGIDITERKTTEGLLQRDREQQIILRGLMETTLQGGALEDTLARCLAQLLGISWLSILPKGGIFLLDEDGKTLRLAVSRNLAPEILSQCDRVPLGVCHCGRAASSGEPQYAECVDGRHDISYPGMADHGHYSLPLLLGGKLQGVLVLYLPIGFQRDPVKEEFISTVTDILSSFLGRKQDEQALRDSEDLTRAVMDSLGSGIAVLDGDGGIIRVNKTWRDFSRDNAGDEQLGNGIGLNYLEVTRQAAARAEEGAREVLEGMLDVMAGKREIFSIEYPYPAPEQERWFQLQVTRLGGATKGLVTSHTNITQRKLAERELERHQQHLEEIVAERTGALQAAEEQVRLILESTADGLFGIDLNGLFSFVNPAACAMLGYAADELIGRLVHRTIHHSHQQGEIYPEAECPMVRTLLEGTIIRAGNEVFWCADGASLPVAYASHPMIRNGEIVGAVVNFTDITTLLETDAAREQALREAERLARIRSEFLANMSHEIRTPLNAVLGLAQVGLRESERRKAHETFRRILDSGQLLLGIVNDILDFSKIEAGRLVIEQAVFSPGEVIDQVVAMIADRAYAKGLDLQVEEAADLPWSCSGDSLRLAQVLVNLLSNAVKFTEQGSVTLQARRDGDSLLFRVGDTGIGMSEEQLGRLFTPFEQADGSTTRRFGGTGLGLAISKRLVDMMGGKLSVASHIGFGTAFQVRLPLHLATGKAATGVGWRVALAGFAAQEKDKLVRDMVAWGLAPTERADDADILICEGGALAPDTLDLARAALARDARVGIVQAPGRNRDTNDVWERARLIERPIRMRHLLSVWDPDAESMPANPLDGGRLQGISVLAAEDNEVNRLVLAEMLMTEGATLTCLENGRAALDQLAQAGAGTYDILLTDIQMPVMDGYETACGARSLDPNLPVIGITAHAMAEERERCRAAGMVEHVAKPVDMEVLVAAILRHVRSRSAGHGAVEPLPAANLVSLSTAPAEPLPAAPGTDVIDWAKLEARFRGKREFVDKLVNAAVSSHADSPAKLRALAEAGDFKDLAFIAHALKGAGGNLMAAELHELAARTERSAKAGETHSRDLAVQLALAVERMLAAMAERLK